MKLSIVLPVFNEENALPALYQSLNQAVPADMTAEFLFINDGSQDRSLEVLLAIREKDPRVHIVDLSRNFGQQLAITAGMDRAQGDVCLIMDADLQQPPDLLPQMLQTWRQGVQIVHAQRSAEDSESIGKRWMAYLFYRLFRTLANVSILPEAGDFCLLDRKVLDAYRQVREPHRFLRGLHQWIGFRHATVRYVRQERLGGRTKYTLVRMIHLALDAVTSFSVLPLRLAGYLGFFIACLSAVYALYTLYIKLVAQTPVPGWTSIMIVVLFIGGVQLLTLGVIGEYIGRIYDQGKHRPLYLIANTYD